MIGIQRSFSARMNSANSSGPRSVTGVPARAKRSRISGRASARFNLVHGSILLTTAFAPSAPRGMAAPGKRTYFRIERARRTSEKQQVFTHPGLVEARRIDVAHHMPEGTELNQLVGQRRGNHGFPRWI